MSRLTILPGLAAFFCSSALLLAAEIDRTKPPVTPPIPDVKLPAAEEFQLDNGLRVVVSRDPRFPLATIRLAFLAGSKYDPKDAPGLSGNVADLLNQGTTSRSASQIAIASADLGGQIAANSSEDVLTVAGSCLSENTAAFLGLLADVAQNASFPDDEVQLEKQNRLQILRGERAQADYLGREALSAALYGDHPYSHIGPTEESIAQLDKKSLENFRDTYLVPNNAYLILVGRLPSASEVKKIVAAQFGKWQKKDVPDYHPPAIPANHKQLLLVDRPGSVQANIFSAHLAPNYSSPDYFPLAVGNMILGGGANSRLFNDIREKRGFAYDAHSITHPLQETGSVSAVTEVRNEVVEPAMQALNGDLTAMSKENVSAVELSESKNSYAGRFILRLERQAAVADQLETIQTQNLPKDFLQMYTTHVRSVEPDQIRATGKYWDPDDATVVVVGDASKIEKSLEKYGSVQLVKPTR
ncbi:MAG TPA: pitrilysin family protein [Bryobacteraceae bacterium]